MERSIREAEAGDIVTIQTCLRSVARSCIFSDQVRKIEAAQARRHAPFGLRSLFSDGVDGFVRRIPEERNIP